MDSGLFNTLWNNRRTILANASSEDEVQHAFTELLANPPTGDPANALVEHGLAWRRGRSGTTRKELSVPDPLDGADTDGNVAGDSRNVTSVEDLRLAEAINETLRMVPWEDANAFILTELRGVPVPEVAEILDMDVPEVCIRVEGVTGLIRSSL